MDRRKFLQGSLLSVAAAAAPESLLFADAAVSTLTPQALPGKEQVDYDYAFAPPHRMTIARPEASEKTLLDLDLGLLIMSWTYEDLRNHPLAILKIPPTDWHVKIQPLVDGKPFLDSSRKRGEDTLPMLYTLLAVSLRNGVVAMTTKLAIRFAALAISLALALGIAPTASATITTNGNGGSTDVGTWYLPGGYTGCTSNWSHSGVDFLPLSYWSTISGSNAPSGTLETLNPCNSSSISEDIAALAAAKVDFISLDLTNSLASNIANGCSSSDYFVTWGCAVAEGVNAWNANSGNSWKIRYSIAVSTQNGDSVEALAQSVYAAFYTRSSFGGPSNYYQINGQPLLVFFGGSGGGPGSDYCSGTCTYADDFYFGNASFQGAGQWGWAPPGVPGVARPTQVDPNGVVENVSPGWFNQVSGNIWASREDGAFYQGDWNVVYTGTPTPRIVILSAFNDWAEAQGLWTADKVSPPYIPNPVWNIDENGNSGGYAARIAEAWTFPDQNIHNDGYWNYTVAAICYLRNNTSTNCGTNSSPAPVLPQPASNLAVSATASASSTLNGSWAVSNVNDGNPGTSWSSRNAGTASPSSPEWIQLTWPSPQTFNTVVLQSRSWNGTTTTLAFPDTFAIQVWNGSTWLTRVQENNFPSPTIPGQPIAFTWGFSDTTTQVRVVATELNTDSDSKCYFRLGEFEVFNEGSAATMPVLVNWGFETPAQVGPHSQANPSGASWTFSGNSGVQESGSGYHAPMAPQGIQTGYLTGSSSSISQTITLPAGTYTLRFLASETDGQSQTINVSYGSAKIDSFGGFTSTGFAPYVTGSFTSTDVSQTIIFAGAGSGTAFIDEVQIFNQSPISVGGGSSSSDPDVLRDRRKTL